MKKLLVASVFAVLPFAANAADLAGDFNFIEESVAAPAGPTVLLEGFGGYNWISDVCCEGELGDDEATGFWLFGGWAGVNVPVSGASGFQFEVFGEGTSTGSTSQDNYYYSAGAATHLFWRDASRGLFGIFGGVVNSDVGDGQEDNAWGGFVGLEGQAYLGMTTLYAQAGYATYFDAEADDDSDIGADPDFPKDVWFVRGIARYFVNEYTKLEGEVGGAFGKFDDGDDSFTDQDFYIINWGVEAERAFTGSVPLSVFLRYEGYYAYEEADNGGVDDHTLDSTVLAGIRARFGGAAENPYVNDRQGVSLNTPEVGRWGGILNGPIE